MTRAMYLFPFCNEADATSTPSLPVYKTRLGNSPLLEVVLCSYFLTVCECAVTMRIKTMELMRVCNSEAEAGSNQRLLRQPAADHDRNRPRKHVVGVRPSHVHSHSPRPAQSSEPRSWLRSHGFERDVRSSYYGAQRQTHSRLIFVSDIHFCALLTET